jgi:hypothetical protein
MRQWGRPCYHKAKLTNKQHRELHYPDKMFCLVTEEGNEGLISDV